MLSIQPQDIPHHYGLSYRTVAFPGPESPHLLHHLPPFYSFIMGGFEQDPTPLGGANHFPHGHHHHHQRHHSQQHQRQHQHQHQHQHQLHQPPQDTSVAQALEIARESPDGARDATISSILENALAQLWSRVMAQPDSYVLTRDEFAVFNYFQHRFIDNKVATAARRRYWDNMTA